MEELIIIKLGGSVITDKAKPFYAKEKVIARLGREIFQAQKQFKGKIIIGHGSGSLSFAGPSTLIKRGLTWLLAFDIV